MKRIFLICILPVIIVACKSKEVPPTQTTIVSPADTVGLSQFQQWKAQHELATPGQYQSPVQQKTEVYRNNVRTTHSGSGNGTVYRSTSESNHTATVSHKKGWSRGAKGAVIGGVGGAVVGAVLDKKNRGAGAVIGGVLGAGAGYGIGHHKDKKYGRY
ncbi:MAG: YMGG-like glycine zipper-containing protein [Flavisolibacter sp.]